MQPMMADNEHRNFISRSYRTRQLNDESLTYLSKFCQAGQHAGGVRKNCEAGCAGFLSVAWSEDPDETVKRGGWRSCLSSIRMHQPGAWRLGQATTPSGNLSSSLHPPLSKSTLPCTAIPKPFESDPHYHSIHGRRRSLSAARSKRPPLSCCASGPNTTQAG